VAKVAKELRAAAIRRQSITQIQQTELIWTPLLCKSAMNYLAQLFRLFDQAKCSQQTQRFMLSFSFFVIIENNSWLKTSYSHTTFYRHFLIFNASKKSSFD